MTSPEVTVDGYRIEPLSVSTWDAFAGLAERHNGSGAGVGACTSTASPIRPSAGRWETASSNDSSSSGVLRTLRWCSTVPRRSPGRSSVRSRSCRTSITASSGNRVSCRFRTFGSPACSSTVGTGAPVWRRWRFRGALALIAAAGGGLVESYPHDLPPGKKTSSSFLYNATRTMYEQLGFGYQRPKGQGNCVMTMVVPGG